ncbi:hypothetical protein SDC9_75615 [bioreactor metagenome]|uniref:Uncharacterized protein n=1 Tax=bioreactor metagenome TaxID=1076179 RepID=A0A644YKQ0_9ZZZZ
MVNKKVQKIIASFMVIGSLAGTIATSTTEAASRDYEHKHNQKIEYRNDNDNHKNWHKKVDSKEQRIYMSKVRQIMNERNIHVPPGHWAYGKRVPQKVMIQYKESHHYDNDNDLLLGLILGAVLAEAVDND